MSAIGLNDFDNHRQIQLEREKDETRRAREDRHREASQHDILAQRIGELEQACHAALEHLQAQTACLNDVPALKHNTDATVVLHEALCKKV